MQTLDVDVVRSSLQTRQCQRSKVQFSYACAVTVRALEVRAGELLGLRRGGEELLERDGRVCLSGDCDRLRFLLSVGVCTPLVGNSST